MISLINGNSLHIPLADQLVHCVVTSPPYWGLRDYGIGGQFGLEPTPEEYIANMVAVFREIWRVLRDDGTLWLNLGDSYNANQGSGFKPDGGRNYAPPTSTVMPRPDWLKPKDLVGIPWRVAFALQADGWYLRSDIIWSKPNPMPESVTDRPTKAHEYLFLMSKQARYYYDAEAVRENYARLWDETNMSEANGWATGEKAGKVLGREEMPNSGLMTSMPTSGRNRRTVWTIATQPYSGAHFATFPEALVEPCVKAGTSERGCCPVCGKAWRRVVERENKSNWEFRKTKGAIGGSMTFGNKQQIGSGWSHDLPAQENTTLGWRPDCTHDAAPIPCTVFDPFAGSGTVGVVAQKLGRSFAGLELSLDYIGLAKERIAKSNGYHVGRLI